MVEWARMRSSGKASLGLLCGSALCAALLAADALALPPAFINFESGQVRPLALSPDGSKLFAVNTPDAQLEIFDVTASGLVPSGSVAVGMEPVAVAARSNSEVWVVNHLSDSVSIVSLSGTPEVTRTLLVGDAPRDIVFAGTGGNRAFITTAHRGQHRTHVSVLGRRPVPAIPQLSTPSSESRERTSGSSMRPASARRWVGRRSRSWSCSATRRGRWR